MALLFLTLLSRAEGQSVGNLYAIGMLLAAPPRAFPTAFGAALLLILAQMMPWATYARGDFMPALLVAIAAAVVLLVHRLYGRIRRFFWTAFYLTLAVAVFAIFVPMNWQLPVGQAVVGHSHSALSSASILVAAFAGALGVAISGYHAENMRYRFMSGVVMLGLLWGMASNVLLNGIQSRSPDRRITFYNVGGFDWDRPTLDGLGVYAGGMFGLLPEYLVDSGWSVSTLQADALASLDISRTRIFCLINCHAVWSDAESSAVERFLRSGGRLLVLGDHTDVFGLQKGLNSLLARWGIVYRFDSGMFGHDALLAGVEWYPSMLGNHFSPTATGISVGASLDVSYPARSLMEARYGFSDVGNRSNAMGAFLGDYVYSGADDRFGGVVLTALRSVGSGGVLVYGDTSGYQNGSLAESFVEHVEPILTRLSCRTVVAPLHVGPVLWILGWTIALVTLRRRAPSFLLGAAVGSYLFGLAVGQPHASLRARDLTRAVLTDYSHFPSEGHYNQGWNYIGSIARNVARQGLLPYKMTEWDSGAVRGAACLVLPASETPLSASERDDLDRMMTFGGTVIAAANSYRGRGLHSLLADYGIRISGNCLGPIPPVEQRPSANAVTFQEASELIVTAESATVLYSWGSTTLVAAVKVGEGRLVAIGDPFFFSSQNVENTYGWNGGVLKVLHSIVHYVQGQREWRTHFPPPLSPKGGQGS